MALGCAPDRNNHRVSRSDRPSVRPSVHLTRTSNHLRCRGFVDEIRIENVKLVALDDFRRRVVVIVMRLIVFVPLETGVDPIKVSARDKIRREFFFS